MEGLDIQAIVEQAIRSSYVEQCGQNRTSAYKVELDRTQPQQLNVSTEVTVVEESKRSRQAADEAERASAVRAELQRLGVSKIDLAYRAVQDGIQRGQDGRLVAHGETGEVSMKEYLTSFVSENPEFLPARIAGGSGVSASFKAPVSGSEAVTLDRIRPGMSADEMQRVREEIVRVASQTLRGL